MKDRNRARAEYAEEAVNLHAFESDNQDDMEHQIIDLIVNLLHLIRRERLSAKKIFSVAAMNYNAEK